MKTLIRVAVAILFVAVLYLIGPRPETPVYATELPHVPDNLVELETYINNRESKLELRPNNAAKIIWANDSISSTDIAILYLHGFSASQMEGDPVHRNIARRFGANLYLARLHSHGYAANSLHNFSAEKLYESALEEMAIATKLGRKLIIMSTSTGGTLALKLASEFPEKIMGLINLSPNVKVRNPAAVLLNDPWGTEIAKIVYGGDYRTVVQSEPDAGLYWDSIYPAEATVQLEELLETTMLEEVFEKITCPVLSLYYYQDEDHQDEVVDVNAIIEMHSMLGTAADYQKHKGLASPQNHVIASSIKSKDYQIVEEEISAFLTNVLGLTTVQ